MSFLQQVQKISDAHYVLPKIGDMRTDVHAYLSDTLFEQTNEALWSQAGRKRLRYFVRRRIPARTGSPCERCGRLGQARRLDRRR